MTQTRMWVVKGKGWESLYWSGQRTWCTSTGGGGGEGKGAVHSEPTVKRVAPPPTKQTSLSGARKSPLTARKAGSFTQTWRSLGKRDICNFFSL